jgi:hypothetical protein
VCIRESVRESSCIHMSKPPNHKSIIIDGSICRCFQRKELLYMFIAAEYALHVFLIVGVYCISYKCLQKTKIYKISSCYSVRKTKNEKSVLCENSVSLISLRSRYV